MLNYSYVTLRFHCAEQKRLFGMILSFAVMCLIEMSMRTAARLTFVNYELKMKHGKDLASSHLKFVIF